jgi:hypothetical protein
MTPTIRLQSPPRRLAGGPRAALTLVLLLLALAGCQGSEEFGSEGTSGSPILLTYPVIARESEVGPGSSSYYVVSGVVENQGYPVSITDLQDDGDLFVYSDAFTTSLCFSAHDGASSESCTATLPSGSGLTSIYVQVKSPSQDGTDFLLNMN